MGSLAEPVTGLPRALTIAGSDSGGGAGIQADLKVFLALGCHGMSAITALTAQNTVEVSDIHLVPPPFVSAQIDAVARDIGVDAAKTGMLGSAAIVDEVARAVSAHGIDQLVVDPVFVSKHRDRLLAEDAVGALKASLFPRALLITPNLYEASALLGGGDITSLKEMKDAAAGLGALGPRGVLVKGGHLPGEESVDVFWDGNVSTELTGVRYDTQDTHGTGCALSAAITAFLAHGDSLFDAVHRGKRFVSGAIRRSIRLGDGFGPVNPGWNLVNREPN
ncbi:MAG: hydroxymethylpyrimidine/phosphomethylpyrimidine kinase [Actinomycetota bacterium]|jgi:hydroxymethylpyrimidine kinase/phosphomethylpyrimidine kinase|nr:hydroxymethylpyrimidine/phosphomethylpyrimidine kinase [Actinomycetota bacterium]